MTARLSRRTLEARLIDSMTDDRRKGEHHCTCPGEHVVNLSTQSIGYAIMLAEVAGRTYDEVIASAEAEINDEVMR